MSYKINKIISFFKLKKFTISKKELEHIDPATFPRKEDKTDIIDLDFINDPDYQYEELLLDLYDEAQQNLINTDDTIHLVTFSSLASYRNLLTTHPGNRKQFFYYLFKDQGRKNNTAVYKFTEENKNLKRFKLSIGRQLLSSRIRLQSSDFVHFFELWKNTHPDEYPLKPLLQQLKKHAAIDTIGAGLNSRLHSFLHGNSIKYLSLQEYMYAKSVIHRVTLDASKVIQVPSSYFFQLLPDQFGYYINKQLNGMNTHHRRHYSEIFKTLCTKTHIDETQLQASVTYIGDKKFDSFLYNALKKVAYYKGRKVSLKRKYLDTIKDGIYGEREYMYKENIQIVIGLIYIVSQRKKAHNIELILMILDRCFSVTSGVNYGPTSRTLGKTCIEVLAINFGIEGKNKLIERYHQTKYKLIKKQIEIISQKLEETTGEALL